MTKSIDSNQLRDILRNLNVELFRYKSGHTTNNVIQNLQGRTHYVDAATLRYFKARILDGGDTCDGTLFYMIESLPDHAGKRGFRFVCFDVYGTVIKDREFYKSNRKALMAFHAWLGEFDLVGHYRQTFADRAGRASREHHDLRMAVNATFGEADVEELEADVEELQERIEYFEATK